LKHFFQGTNFKQKPKTVILTDLCNKNFTDAFKPKNKQLLSNGKNTAEKFYTAIYTVSTNCTITDKLLLSN